MHIPGYSSLKLLCTAALLSVLTVQVQAADPENGKVLYEEVEIERTIKGIAYTDANCDTCHDTAFLLRKDRKVTSYAKLEAYVEGCNTNLDVGWFPDEVSDVSAYMNQQIYHFKTE